MRENRTPFSLSLKQLDDHTAALQRIGEEVLAVRRENARNEVCVRKRGTMLKDQKILLDALLVARSLFPHSSHQPTPFSPLFASVNALFLHRIL